ncbi:MAG: DUF1622 domain-containing protein [Synechococcales cyanobacterium T60_A2020_003]|nr:DUF1622 domain-containing protein [Synechococcales cyanobacterium T60_A2020_003]
MEIDAIQSSIASTVLVLNSILISTCQLLAIFVISVGIIRALVIYLSESLLKTQSPESFQRSRLEMGYSFSLGLSFLIGSTIMKTMVSSQREELGRLITIIGVRTALNLLLERAIAQTSPQSEISAVQANADGQMESMHFNS